MFANKIYLKVGRCGMFVIFIKYGNLHKYILIRLRIFRYTYHHVGRTMKRAKC